MKQKTRNLFDTDTRAGRRLTLLIHLLIVVSLITFSIETLPGLQKKTVQTLNIIETFTVIIFTIEYLLRIYIAETKLQFIFSFFGVVDLLAVLPFYLSTGIDLRSIRAIRLLRLFRVVKILRYNNAIEHFHRAVAGIKEELIIFFSLTLIILYLSAVGIYYFESEAQPDVFKSIFHSLWWAVATLTTVGYGDVYPVTVGGKVFTFFMLLIGLGLIAVPSGLLAAALTKTAKK